MLLCYLCTVLLTKPWCMWMFRKKHIPQKIRYWLWPAHVSTLFDKNNSMCNLSCWHDRLPPIPFNSVHWNSHRPINQNSSVHGVNTHKTYLIITSTHLPLVTPYGDIEICQHLKESALPEVASCVVIGPISEVSLGRDILWKSCLYCLINVLGVLYTRMNHIHTYLKWYIS